MVRIDAENTHYDHMLLRILSGSHPDKDGFFYLTDNHFQALELLTENGFKGWGKNLLTHDAYTIVMTVNEALKLITTEEFQTQRFLYQAGEVKKATIVIKMKISLPRTRTRQLLLFNVDDYLSTLQADGSINHGRVRTVIGDYFEQQTLSCLADHPQDRLQL